MALLPGAADHFHLFPVVWKFLAAIQAHNVGSGQRGCLITTAIATNGYRKTITAMPATKDCFDQFTEHATSPGTYSVSPALPRGTVLSSQFKRSQEPLETDTIASTDKIKGRVLAHIHLITATIRYVRRLL